jgi:hypothetical protein
MNVYKKSRSDLPAWLFVDSIVYVAANGALHDSGGKIGTMLIGEGIGGGNDACKKNWGQV